MQILKTNHTSRSPLDDLFSEIHSGTSSCINTSCSSTSPANNAAKMVSDIFENTCKERCIEMLNEGAYFCRRYQNDRRLSCAQALLL